MMAAQLAPGVTGVLRRFPLGLARGAGAGAGGKGGAASTQGRGRGGQGQGQGQAKQLPNSGPGAAVQAGAGPGPGSGPAHVAIDGSAGASVPQHDDDGRCDAAGSAGAVSSPEMVRHEQLGAAAAAAAAEGTGVVVGGSAASAQGDSGGGHPGGQAAAPAAPGAATAPFPAHVEVRTCYCLARACCALEAGGGGGGVAVWACAASHWPVLLGPSQPARLPRPPFGQLIADPGRCGVGAGRTCGEAMRHAAM